MLPRHHRDPLRYVSFAPRFCPHSSTAGTDRRLRSRATERPSETREEVGSATRQRRQSWQRRRMVLSCTGRATKSETMSSFLLPVPSPPAQPSPAMPMMLSIPLRFLIDMCVASFCFFFLKRCVDPAALVSAASVLIPRERVTSSARMGKVVVHDRRLGSGESRGK